MTKIINRKKTNLLYKRVDEVPENKRKFVDAILETIIKEIKEEETKTEKKKIDLSQFSGTLKLPKDFDAIKYQRKLRDEWGD